MRRNILSLFALIYLLHFAQAQKNIVPGYIITLDSDTVSAQVDYRIWNQNPKEVTFIIDDKEVVYQGYEIQGFGVEDLFFKGAIVETNISSRDPNKLESTSDLNIRIDTTFLQAVVTGPKSLYMSTNRFNIQNFYIESNGTLTLLTYKKYILNYEVNEVNNGNDRVAVNQRYIGQLTVLLGDCKNIDKHLQSVKYTESSLQSVFLNYYECSGFDHPQITRTVRWKGNFGIIGGVTRTPVNYKNTYDRSLIDANFKNSINPTYGLTFNFFKENSPVTISTNLLFTSFTNEGKSESKNGIFVTSHTIKYGISQVHLSILPKYNVIKFNNSQAFLTAGVSWAITVGHVNEKSSTTSFVGTSSSGPALDEINQTEFGFIGGIGTKLNKLTIEYRTGYFNGSANLAKAIPSYFLVGYNF